MAYNELLQAQKVEKEHFYYASKRYLIEKILAQHCPRDLKILDIGCGTGLESKILSQFGQVTGLDGSKQVIELCRKRGFKKLILYEVKKRLPFKNNTFDMVCAFDVLEHLKYDELIIKEIYRILKKNGLFFFTVPAYPFLFSSHDRALEHQRRYTKKQILELLEGNFAVIKLSFVNMFLFPFAALWRIFNKNKTGAKKTDIYLKIPHLINRIFIFIFKKETDLISHYSLPLGLSIIGLVRKK